MDNYRNDLIRKAKDQAYHKGFLDGYQRGVADSRAGIADPHLDSDLLNKPIQFLNLTKRPFNSLDRAGFCTIGDIVSLRREEIWKIRNLGSKGLHEIAQALWNQGIWDSEWNEWLYTD